MSNERCRGLLGKMALVVAMTTIVAACGAATATPRWFSGAAGADPAPPGCQATAPGHPVLTGVRTATTAVPAAPFGVVPAPTGHTAFVVLKDRIGVLDTAAFPPKLVRAVALPSADLGRTGATGLAITHDGRRLVVAADTGAVVLDAAKTAAGAPGAVLGVLTGTAGTSAIAVSISPDDRFAFVSQEYGNTATGGRGAVEVFALTGGFGPGAYVGSVALGQGVVGTAVSAREQRLYVTSESASGGDAGQLTALDLATMETNPAAAVRATVSAGCQPVRVVVSPDDATVWVTARASNALLAFDARALSTDPGHALRASVPVGTAPVGLAVVRGGTRVITADSNRFNAPGSTTGLSVVDTAAALGGKPAYLGAIPTGAFPREMSVSPDDRTLLVSVFGAKEVQAVDTTTLP